MSSTCKLCSDVKCELKDILKSVGSSIFIIIDKLFAIRFENKKDPIHLCDECYDLLLKCHELYERVSQAQQKLNNNGKAIIIKEEIICDVIVEQVDQKESYEYKTEFQDVDNTIYFDDCDLPSTKDEDYMSDDDLPIIQTINKISTDNKTNVTKKKNKIVKKRKKEVSKCDLNNLIDKDGLFTVNGKVLTELVDKFYKLVCDVCLASDFTTLKDLFDHFEEKHFIPGYVVCCNKKLKSKRNINYHMAWHVQPSAFECETCHKTVARPSEIKYHMQSHLPHKQRPYQCAQCGKGFIFLSKFRKHLRKHEDELKDEEDIKKEVKEEGEDTTAEPPAPKILINKDGVFTIKGAALDKLINEFYNLFCELCTESRTFKTIKALFEHYDVVHKTRGYVTCCDTQFDRRKYINYHMAKHLQPSAFECHICKKSVSRPGELKFHIQHHLPDSQKPLQCDECGKGFVYLSTFKKHKLTHVPVEKRKIYECKFCNKTFNILTSYSVHVSSKHSGPVRLCSHCGKSIKGKINYQNHLKTHEPDANKESERVICPQCGISIANMMGLKKHLRRHAVSVKCEQCDYIAHSNTQLKKHVMIRHTDLKPHVCMICNKGFKLKHSMKVHMAQHTGERNYSCPYCPRTFMDPGNCYSHQKKMHPIELKNNPKKRKNFDIPPSLPALPALPQQPPEAPIIQQ